MNKKTFWILFLGIFFLIPTIFISCNEKKEVKTTEEKVQTYTCSMHPQIVSNKPGTCPICGMDLVPFEKNNAESFLTLGESQEALGNITTTTVGMNEFSSFTRLNGRLAIDPEKTTYISSRVPGRIETLYIKETGVPVRKGQALYKIYSEELSTLQQEYLLTKAQVDNFPDDKRFEQMEKAARQKLLLYGQTESQLNELVKQQSPAPYTTYFAPASGIVSEISVMEGQYVTEGGTIMKLENYDNLWVEADVYPSDVNKIKVGEKVKVIVSGYENEPQTMMVMFINPALQPGSQIMQIRGTIANPKNQWQAGLQAIVLLPSSAQKNVLTLPVDAVIRDVNGAHIWIEIDKGKYEPRMVTLGQETSNDVEITSGLKAGEKVVVTGAYLLSSEFTLKKGKDPMAGMKM